MELLKGAEPPAARFPSQGAEIPAFALSGTCILPSSQRGCIGVLATRGRAGEVGTGSTFVAQKVRELAQRPTKDIKAIVNLRCRFWRH
jgi:hypothetical protein